MRGPFALPVLALLAVYTVVLYRRALAIGVLSDGWVLLEIGSRGLRRAPFVLLSYHTIPLTNLLMAVLWKLFGLSERWYQAANLAELALVAWCLYLLGSTLFRQPRVGLLASLLFLANGSFYEVPFWATVGNFQSLAALLYLGAIFAVHRAFQSRRRGLCLTLFSLCGLAAFFTYEPAVSVLGVGVLYAAVFPAAPSGAAETFSWRGQARRARLALAAALPALGVVLASKLYTSSLGYQAAFLPRDGHELKFRIYLLIRGCVSIFSLRGADHKLYQILTLGFTPPGGSVLEIVLVAAWGIGLALGGALFVWRTRLQAARFATVWFAAHMLAVAIATAPVSRHFYLGALPASLLAAWWIWSAADRGATGLARHPSFPDLRLSEAQAGTLLAFLFLILLTAYSSTDREVATTLHRVASQASQQVVHEVQRRLDQEPAATPRVALVNMPAILAQDGVGAYAFVNGLHPLLQLSTRGRVSNPELFYTYASFADGKFANASLSVSLGELDRRVHDPASLVLMFDRRTRTVTEANLATWRLPARYDFDAAPFLEWENGAWPWFRVYAGQPLELPLAVAGDSPWVGLKFLHDAATDFSVLSGSQPVWRLPRRRIEAPCWPSAAFPLPAAGGRASLTIQPRSEVWLAGVWSFSPPAAYTPEAAPFLSWMLRPVPAFALEEPIELPLAAPTCLQPPCTIRLEYLAERGRDLSVAVAGGATRDLAFGRLTSPQWRSLELSGELGRPAVVRLAPRGRLAALVRRLAWRQGDGRENY